MVKNPHSFFIYFLYFLSPSWFNETKENKSMLVVLFHGLTSMKNDKSLLDSVLFVSFFESKKEIKVYSVGENEWLNNMLLCSKHMELT
jgi:hypothetical protein